MKKKFFAICGLIVVVLVVGTLAYAENFFYTVTPIDLADGPTFANGQGGVPFGYDPDMPPPIGVLQSGPSGFGGSCYWSDVQGSAAGGPRDYTSFRMSPKDIFGLTGVTISDLSYISYWTKNLNTSLIDWQIKIYTESTVEWYGYRFNFTRPQNPDSTNWYHLSTTIGLDHHLKVDDIYDKETDTHVTVDSSNDELSKLSTAYGSEMILFIDIIASFASNSPAVDSLLDGVVIGLQSGDVATMDLEAAIFSCVGFEPPMDNGTVKVKKNRVLPLKAEIVDASGNPVTDAVIGQYPPIVEVTKKTNGSYEDPVDPSDLLPTGHGTEGNEFIFDGVKWFYNLGTKMFSSIGDYKIIMKSPDEGLYIIDPSCEAYFNIEKR